MYLNNTFELSMVLDSEKFNKVFTRANKYAELLNDEEDEYIDQSFASLGVTVTYRDSQYKKKVKLIINSNLLLNSDEPEPDKLIRKLEERIDEYFGSKYQTDDFNLTGMVLATNIDVGDRESVSAYLKVLQRVGKIKGFSETSYECFDDVSSFCLDGNSNGIQFLIYDFEGLLRGKLSGAEHGRKQLKSMIDHSTGILRAEVRLSKPKAIRTYTDEPNTVRQLAELSEKGKDIFMETFVQAVPFGDFHKKDKAVEIIRQEVKDMLLRRKMLQLVALIPEKKSLLLAQKALNHRRVDDVMMEFAVIDLSPVTISKRHDVKHLTNLYTYL